MNNNIVEFLLDNMNVSAYIINKKDYRFIYVNTYLRNLFHNVDKGQICYEVLWNRDSPCHDCPIANNQKTVTRFQKYFHHIQKTFSIDAIKMDYDMQDIYIFTGHDITEQKLFENQLSKLAYYDSTLGIKNLYSFHQYFANVNICQIYLLKIKNMRNFYALYGQNYIDIILKKIIQSFSWLIHHQNIYYLDNGIIGFLVFDLNQIKYMNAIRYKINQILEQKGMKLDSIQLQSTFIHENDHDIIKYIEYLFHEMEKKGQSIHTVFNHQHIDNINRHVQLRHLLEQKNIEEKIKIYIQPIYSIENKKCNKFEILSRLYDDTLQYISPIEFIPIMEELGKMDILTMYLIEEACIYIKNQDNVNIKLSVNIPPYLLLSKTFLQNIAELSKKYYSVFHHLYFEVTEDFSITDYEPIKDAMKILRGYGIHFSVDDFGSGYSNLNHLVELPIQELKIDKRLIDKIEHDKSYVIVVEDIIKLAHQLHLKVVAEGIETKTQFDLLKSMNCDFIQGYYICKPYELVENR